jgi:hypothetical protein
MPNRTPEERKATPATAQELYVLSGAVDRLTKLVVVCLVAIVLSLIVFVAAGAHFAGVINDQNEANQHVQDCRGVVGGGITNDQAQLMAAIGRAVVAANTHDLAGVKVQLDNIRVYSDRLDERVKARPAAVMACAASDTDPTDTGDTSPMLTTAPTTLPG